MMATPRWNTTLLLALLLAAPLLALASRMELHEDHWRKPVPGYCANAPYALVPVKWGGSCTYPGNWGTLAAGGKAPGCSDGGCWCNKPVQYGKICDQAFPNEVGQWKHCRVAAPKPSTKCAKAGTCNLYFKQVKYGVVQFYTKPGCHSRHLIAPGCNTNHKLGLVVPQGADAGCIYSQNDAPATSSYAVGRNKRGQWQGLAVLDVCYKVVPFTPIPPPNPPPPPPPPVNPGTCQCTGASDPQGWSAAAPAYVCPGIDYTYSGGDAIIVDSCGKSVAIGSYTLQRQVNGGPFVDVGVFTTLQLSTDKNLFAACGTYRLAALNAACGASFFRTILVREVDMGTFNDPRIDQTGKVYCPNSAVVPTDLFGALQAKVRGSSVTCGFPIMDVKPANYPDVCQGNANVVARYLICPATVAPVVSDAVVESRTVATNVFESLVPSEGWAPVTASAPEGLVVYQCPGSNFNLGALTLTSKCPGRGPYTPPLTYGGDFWRLKKTGCGMLSATGSQCGQTFGRKIVQDIDSIDMPATTAATVCPGATIPASALPATTTANIVGAPAGTPKCTAQGQFDPQSPLGTAPNACGVATVTRTYNACSKSISAKADITVTETFTGFDPSCPFKFTTSCAAAGTVQAAKLVGAPTVSDLGKCEFTQTVQASVCGGGKTFDATYKFSACSATKVTR